MDEEVAIINSSTRNEKIKNFFIKNKKKLIIVISITLIIIIGYFSLNEIKKINKIKLASKYNLTIIDYNTNKIKQDELLKQMTHIIERQDQTFSPLALYFIIDNNITDNSDVINSLFNKLIKQSNLDYEIKNLIIYKKALYNSDFLEENELIKVLNPIINSESIWKSHALYLMGEFFYSNNEKQKAKEFFNKILLIPNNNQNIKMEAQKRLNRDLSE
jgi:predicted negative regulator of RcsB-dependent stress response|tara:strand:- start:242 stop:892 length:651 start_codon:yes stop_codon:yes gene_type:complete